MNTIILTIGLLLAFVTGFFTAIKAVSLGLKWQMQAKEGIQPELKSPIAPIVEAVQQRADNKKVEEANKYTERQIEEYSPFFTEV